MPRHTSPLTMQWGPQSLPRHDTLATLSFNWRGDSYTSTYYHGSTPSQTSTGLIAPWMVRIFSDLPSLSTIYLAPDLWPQEHEDRKPHVLHLRSYFCEGSDILYHIAQHVATNFAMLGTRTTAPIWRPEEDVQNSREALDGPWKAFRRPPADVEPGTWIHLTSYRGRSVPHEILHSVCRRARSELGTEEGVALTRPGRDLELSNEVLQLLDKWYDETLGD